MNVARIAPVHELQFETPIEFTGLRYERALKIDYELIQQQLVRAIIKKPAEVLITFRAVGIESDTAIDPAGNLEARLGRRRRGRLTGRSDTDQNHCAEKLDDLFHY